VKLIVARKRFHRPNHDNELRQLIRLRSSLSTHKRIVSDLAIFMMGNELNIIMPWADMDLEDFLGGRHREIQPIPSLLDLIQESKKIASAIHFLHESLQLESEWQVFPHQAICHADLKPRNILVFRKEGSSTGIWRITDFGVARIAHRELCGANSGYPTSADAPPPKGGAYQAPDLHAQRRSDVWSFGCILVRLFALGLDPASLPRLDERRRVRTLGDDHHDCFHQGIPPVLNHGVEKWIQDLTTEYFEKYDNEFLEQMKKLFRSMLEIDYCLRSSANQVQSDLHELHELLKDSEFKRRPSTVATLPSSRSTSITTLSSTSTPVVLDEDIRHETSQTMTVITKVNPTTPSLSSPRRTGNVREVGGLVNNIKLGGIVEVLDVLKDIVDVEQSHEGNKPLFYAIENSKADVIDELSRYQQKYHHSPLDVRTLVRTSSGEQISPLEFAIQLGDADTVRAVIDADILLDDRRNIAALLNERLEGGRTPLMVAALWGHASVVTLLLDRRADHTVCIGESKENCLHFAVNAESKSKEDVIMAFKGRMDHFDQLPPDTRLDTIGTTPRSTGYVTPLMLHIKVFRDSPDLYRQKESLLLWKRKFKALLDGHADLNKKFNPGTAMEKTSFEAVALCNDNKHLLLADILRKGGATLPKGYKIRASGPMKKILQQAKREP
jgi:serine/threonine protein kinase